MKNDDKFRKVLRAVYHFAVFFMFIGAVITCCLVLFLETMDITLTEEKIRTAAKLTFINVMFISLICTVIDKFRRKLTVDIPIKRITDASERIINGDFGVRIPKSVFYNSESGLNDIIDCFNKVAEELSGTETLRTDFIANVSHELKTPLAVMNNYAVMLMQDDLTEDKRKEYAKIITDSSRRLTDLISNILKLNKLENQKIFPVSEKYNLSEQLCECMLLFEDLWEKKELEIDVNIEEDVYIKNDAELMSLVWNNLISNAVKFTECGGRVSLELTTDSDFATVRVSDTGCGISKDTGAHIFDKFYQGDTSHASQGNGLGLALVKRVIDITGSDISVTSEVGKGSTFAVKLWRCKNEKRDV